MAFVDSVNRGFEQPNSHKDKGTTGINKQPQDARIEVRAPGPKRGGLGSGLVGDFIGDHKHHGGDDQALYAFASEDLDAWQLRLERAVPNGFFGENLTTTGIDVNAAALGEVWRIGDTVRVQVTTPRIPCNTFRGWVGEKGWLRTFALDAKPGAYLRILTPGTVGSADPITVESRPDHDVTISLVFRALTTQRELLPALLAAGEHLGAETRAIVESGRTIRLG